MTPQERAEKIAQICLCGESARYAIAEAVRVAIVEATNSELEKRRAAEIVVEILTQRLGYIASVAAPGEEDDRQPTLVEGNDKPPEPALNLLRGDMAQRMSDELRAMGLLSYTPEKVRRRFAEIIEEFKPAEPEAREAAAPDTFGFTEPVTCAPEMMRVSLEEIRRLAHVGYVRGAPGVDSICLKIRSLCDGVLNEPDLEVPYVPLICKNCNKSAPTLSTAGWCSACFLKHEHPDFVTGNTPRREQEPPQKRVNFEHTDTTACNCWKCRNLRGQTD